MEARITTSPGVWIRHGNIAVLPGVPAIATAPATNTDGIAIPGDLRDISICLALKHVAAGVRSFNVQLFGYRPNSFYFTAAGVLTEIAASAEWVHLGTITVSGAADASEAHQLEGLPRLLRLAAQITDAVGAPTVYADFGFGPHAGNPEVVSAA